MFLTVQQENFLVADQGDILDSQVDLRIYQEAERELLEWYQGVMESTPKYTGQHAQCFENAKTNPFLRAELIRLALLTEVKPL